MPVKRAGLRDIETANEWIRNGYLPQHNARFPAKNGTEIFRTAST